MSIDQKGIKHVSITDHIRVSTLEGARVVAASVGDIRDGGRRGGVEMTYKLEPGLSRITSPVLLIFPDGTEKRYANGKAVTEAVFDKRWKVTEMRARDGEIEVGVEEADVPSVNPIGEETFF